SILCDDVQKAYLSMAFPIPSINHPDLYPLEVLAAILGEGKSSRLYQKVKSEDRLVYSIYSSSVALRDSGLFMVGGLLEAEKVKPVVTKIFQEIYRLQKSPPSLEEMRKAKLNLTSEFIYNKETLEGESNQLGYFETVVGNLSFEQNYVDKINQVTITDILRVAKTYLNPQNLNIGVLLPEKAVTVITEAEIKTTINQVASSGLSSAETSAFPSTQKFLLPNGITLIVRENRRLPIVAMQGIFLGGVRWEKRENNGINNLIAEMLTSGTKRFSAEDIARKIDAMAGKINGFSGSNSLGIFCTVLSQFFEPALELFSEVLTNPSFPEKELIKKKADVIAEIERRSDQPISFLMKNFNSFFFGNHPYGMDTLGTKEVVQKLTSRDLSDYYSYLARAKNLVITVVGDVEAESAKKIIEAAFKEFPSQTFNPPEVPSVSIPNIVRQKVIPHGKKTQAQILLGFPGIDLKSPDKYALDVLNTILAG
ncbi:MAG: insulinase family protein, partial [Desulfobacterota bacterium]|nr:insulinase family protein [Thermodesulfobacteriota bacterium]